MNILQLVQEFCGRQGLPIPTLAIGSQDDQLEQIARLANEVGEDLVTKRAWTPLIRECVFTSVAGEDQGKLTDLTSPLFYRILNETIFDRTRRLRLFGPKSPQQWQMLKSLPFTGPFYQYRIREGRLMTSPPLPEGHTIAFEWVQRAICYNANDNAYKAYFTKDDDECLLDEQLMIKGLKWKWKFEKGFPYDADLVAYKEALAAIMSADGNAPTIHMDDDFLPGPVVIVPPGNWTLP